MSAIDIIAALFSGEGAQDYLGEEVSVPVHMHQAAGMAEAAGAPDTQVAAALLHDVGRICGETVSGRQLMAGIDNQHGETGAAWLAQWFDEDVTEPVRLHVAAKNPVSDGPEFDHFRPLLHSLIRQHLVPFPSPAGPRPGEGPGAGMGSGRGLGRGSVAGHGSGWEGSRDSALTATELCTVKATALPR